MTKYVEHEEVHPQDIVRVTYPSYSCLESAQLLSAFNKELLNHFASILRYLEYLRSILVGLFMRVTKELQEVEVVEALRLMWALQMVEVAEAQHLM